MRNKTLNPLPPERKGYIAAILDGEGYVTVSRKKDKTMKVGYGYRPMVGVTNTNKKLLDFLMELTGLGRIHRSKAAKKNHKPSYQWVLWSQQARQLLEEVLPYLVIKKTQAELIIAMCKAARYGVGRDGLTSDELAFQRRTYEQIKKLNKRGTDAKDVCVIP